MAQLDHKSRKELYQRLNLRIDEANAKIKEIRLGPQTKVTDAEGKELPPASEHEEPAPYKLTQKDIKDIQYLQERITNLQMSLRLAFNSEWIIEQRKIMLAGCKDVLASMDAIPGSVTATIIDNDAVKDEAYSTTDNRSDKTEQSEKLDEMNAEKKNNIKLRTIQMANDLSRANNCKKKGCWGRGFIGWPSHKLATGEFTLCDCTLKTISYYHVNKD